MDFLWHKMVIAAVKGAGGGEQWRRRGRGEGVAGRERGGEKEEGWREGRGVARRKRGGEEGGGVAGMGKGGSLGS